MSQRYTENRLTKVMRFFIKCEPKKKKKTPKRFCTYQHENEHEKNKDNLKLE